MDAPSRLSCLVVDEHPVVRRGVGALLEQGFSEVELLDAPTVEAALDSADELKPDVILIDPRKGPGDTEAALVELAKRLDSPVVVFTADGGARQREILQMLADGMQTDAVAKQLGLSTETVRTHTKRILAKLDADTRTQAVAIGIRNGMID